MKHAIILSASVIAFSSCGTTPTSSGSDGPDWVAGVLAGDLADEYNFASKDPSRITVPILRAPDLEAEHGKPEYFVMRDGSYAARHDLGGKRYVTLVGTSRPAKKRGYEPYGNLTVMGQRTGYFVTGNEDPEITTKAVTLRAPDGRSATYLVIHGDYSGAFKEKALVGGLPRLSW